MVNIRRFEEKDFDQYITLCQRVFTATYANDKRIPAELFSREQFLAPAMRAHFLKATQNNSTSGAWVAEKGGQLVGVIAVTYHSDHDEVHGFYVDTHLQGQGIGSSLWAEMLEYRQHEWVAVDVFTHAQRAVAMYKQWGFRRQLGRRKGYIHWDSWPPGYVLRTVRLRRRYAK